MKAEKLEKIIEYSKTNPIKDKKYLDKSKRRMVESYRRLETIDLLLLSRLQPIDLLRESLVKIESTLLTKNLTLIITLCLVFVVINIVNDLIYNKKNN